MSISAYFESLFEDGKNIEIRHQTQGQWKTVWCKDMETLRQEHFKRRNSGNLFTSIHHSPHLLSRPIQNSDVDRYTRIFIDLDPARPRDTSSTASELISARIRARAVRDYLLGHGWPMPAMGISGNGAHLYYRCAYPVTDEFSELFRVLYDGLSRRLSDAKVMLDRAVGNPGRISVLFGSIKRKGAATARRPHRQSIIKTPRYWRQVSRGLLDKICNLYAKRDEPKPIKPAERILVEDGSKGDFRTLDTLGWFAAHGSPIKRLKGDWYGVRCPWHDEHSTASPKNQSDTVVLLREGLWDLFFCHHAHCRERRMIDVINLRRDADGFCSKPYEPRRSPCN